jgi:ADP-ribose pyrophosphatase YjhB (NUDIX family)
MTTPVTRTLLHDLAAASHAEGVTHLAVEAAISHEDNDDRILLIAEPGPDFTDETWRLPGGPVLAGQTLTDALHPAVAAIGLSIEEVTGYLGHHDHAGDQATTRVFRFAVAAADPGAICQHAGTGHRWAGAEDLDRPPADTAGLPDSAVITPADGEPPLAGPLRAWARGIYPDEAAVELLISHATFLRRADFTGRCISTSASGDGTSLAAVDWPAAITALADGLPCSGGEQRMLRLAASLGDGIPVNLRHALTGIDDHGIQFVAEAVLHASGHRPSPGFHDHY